MHILVVASTLVMNLHSEPLLEELLAHIDMFFLPSVRQVAASPVMTVFDVSLDNPLGSMQLQ